MKKLLAVILSLIIALSAMLTLAGCDIDTKKSKKDKDKDKDDKTSQSEKAEDTELSDQEIFIGDWRCEIDMAEYMDKIADVAAEQMPEHAEFLSSFKIKFNMDFTFTEDTVTMTLDKEALKNSLYDLKDELAVAMKGFVESMLAQSGTDMTLDELLAAQGMTMDEWLEKSFEEAFTDEAFEENFGNIDASTEYKIEDGKLYALKDGELDLENYMVYEIVSQDEILITEISMPEEDSEEAKEILDMILPLTFKRK